jgi:hypothetical protein
MVEPSGTEAPEPTGWTLLRTTVRELVFEMRHPTPLTVRYLRCDGCGQITPHARLISIGSPGIPEAVCGLCGFRQPRTVGDEITADTIVTCVGRRHRRIGFKRSRRQRGRPFDVPAAAPTVLCPCCSTVQPPTPPTRSAGTGAATRSKIWPLAAKRRRPGAVDLVWAGKSGQRRLSRRDRAVTPVARRKRRRRPGEALLGIPPSTHWAEQPMPDGSNAAGYAYAFGRGLTKEPRPATV